MLAADTPTPNERISAAALLAAALGLKLAYVFRMGFDTDEPQHLHVAWAWTQGLVQYRDVFDNHTPLFHLLAAPIVRMIGERPDLLVWMRLSVIPLWGLSLWCVYRIGRSLFSTRSAIWSAVLAGVFPSFFLTTVEFRADDLWAALWLATLVVLFGGALRPGRALAAGCLLGATFATSMKTVMLLATFAGASALLLVLDHASRSAVNHHAFWTSIACLAAGATVVPIALISFFARLHALDEFFDCVIVHNLSGAGLWGHRLERSLLFVTTFAAFLAGVRAIRRASPAGIGRRRAVLFLATSLYGAGVSAFWPLVTRQDFLPFYPLAVVLSVPLLLERVSRVAAARAVPIGAAALSALALIEIGLAMERVPPWKNGTGFQVGLVADVLRLTRPDELVMDLKGESLFRRRPIRYVLENVTEERIRRGEIRDDFAERLIATRTYVSVHDNARFPPRARQFLLENYLPVGHLRVAGRLLAAHGNGAVIDFDVELPGRYAILSPGGDVAGVLDGSPFAGPRFLAAGRHAFKPAAPVPTVPLALVWARATEQGYSPFHPESPL